MVDARLRGEWLTSLAHDRLSDPAYRVLHNALMWSAEQGTDGAIDARALRYLHPRPVESTWLDELTAAGFWEPLADGGFQMLGWDTDLGQSTAADVNHQRERNRNKQRAYRERVSATSHAAVTAEDSGRDTSDAPRQSKALRTGVVTGNKTGNVTGVVGKARRGPKRASPGPLSGDARTAQRGHDCALDGHKLVRDGTCAVCEYRGEVET